MKCKKIFFKNCEMQYNLLPKINDNDPPHFHCCHLHFGVWTRESLRTTFHQLQLNCVYCYKGKHSHTLLLQGKKSQPKPLTICGENSELENRGQSLQFMLLFLFLIQTKTSLCLSFLPCNMAILISAFLKIKGPS